MALPMLGTGAAGLEPTEFLGSFGWAVRSWAEGPSSLQDVQLVVLPIQANDTLALLTPQLDAIYWAEQNRIRH